LGFNPSFFSEQFIKKSGDLLEFFSTPLDGIKQIATSRATFIGVSRLLN